MNNFVPTGAGNEILSCDGFDVSFRPSSAGPAWGIGMFAADHDSDETALIVGNNMFILNGDFRMEYAALSEDGLASCIKFFLGKPELHSSWSASSDKANDDLSRIENVA